MKLLSRGFTLIEVLIASTLFGLILIIGLQALVSMGLTRNRVIDRSDLMKDLYATVETLADAVKKGGTLDYEEYFNRKSSSYGLSGSSLFSGYLMPLSGFGNYGSGGVVGSTTYGDSLYFCRSQTGTDVLGNQGCWLSVTGSTTGTFLNTTRGAHAAKQQRFGQYQLQFKDLNFNQNDDREECELATPSVSGAPWGDQDCNGNPRGDGDDADIGRGPVVLDMTGAYQRELPLIRTTENGLERQILRWYVSQDPDAPSALPTCDTTLLYATGACRGRIQVLRLIGQDIGFSHSNAGSGRADGLIDTWICHADYPCTGPTVGGGRLPGTTTAEWVDLFPSDISIKSVRFIPSNIPNSGGKYGWATPASNIGSPYVKVIVDVGFAWKKRLRIGNIDPSVNIVTTINLPE